MQYYSKDYISQDASMKTLYLDTASGISGDMFAAAGIDLLEHTGVDIAPVLDPLAQLNMPNFKPILGSAERGGVTARTFRVDTAPEHAHRHLTDIRDIIRSSPLPEEARDAALAIFELLGEAEAKAHEIDIAKVHFHEVGAVDSIVDITAAALIISLMRREWDITVAAGPPAVGRGTIDFSHGKTDLPVPAVRHLLEGIPTRQLDINAELTTPTGAAILRYLAPHFSEECPFNPESRGTGAGNRELTQQPNVLRMALSARGAVLSEKKKSS